MFLQVDIIGMDAYFVLNGKVKTVFLNHLCIKTNILPRQARDKHGENSKKGPFFLRDNRR
jgi:hypothetical protein